MERNSCDTNSLLDRIYFSFYRQHWGGIRIGSRLALIYYGPPTYPLRFLKEGHNPFGTITVPKKRM